MHLKFLLSHKIKTLHKTTNESLQKTLSPKKYLIPLKHTFIYYSPSQTSTETQFIHTHIYRQNVTHLNPIHILFHYIFFLYFCENLFCECLTYGLSSKSFEIGNICENNKKNQEIQDSTYIGEKSCICFREIWICGNEANGNLETLCKKGWIEIMMWWADIIAFYTKNFVCVCALLLLLCNILIKPV